MNITRIEYVGCAYSGRRESVRQALKHFGADYTVNQDVHQLHAFSHIIQLGVSRLRSAIYYEPINKSSLPPSVVPEIQRLCAADGIVFVIDSQLARLDACEESYEKLVADMKLFGRDAYEIPTIFQINKRDLSEVCDVEWVHHNLKSLRSAYTESIAAQGIGVVESIAALMNLLGTYG